MHTQPNEPTPPPHSDHLDAKATQSTSDTESQKHDAARELESAYWLWVVSGVLFMFGIYAGSLFGATPEPPTHASNRPDPTPAANVPVQPSEETISAPSPPALHMAPIRGSLVDEDGHPIPNAQVTLTQRGIALVKTAPPARKLIVQTNARGEFDFGKLPPGSWHLEAKAVGFETQTIAAVAPSENDVHDLKMSVTKGMVFHIIRDGVPVQGAQVKIAAPGLWPALELTSDQDGRVQTNTLPAGAYEVLARVRDGMRSWGTLKTIFHDGDAHPEGQELPLYPTPTVRVVLTDESMNMPVSGALVTLSEDLVHILGISQWSDYDGEAILYGLPRRTYTLQVRASGYLREVRTLDFDPASLDGGVLDIPMQTAGSIQGKVVDEIGNGRELVQIICHVITDQGGQWSVHRDATALTDSIALPAGGDGVDNSAGSLGYFTQGDGEFEVSGLPVGTVILETRRDGYQPTFAGPFHLSRGATLSGIEMTLQPGHRLEGIVVDDREDPIPSARVRIRAARTPNTSWETPGMKPLVRRTQETQTDRHGSFEQTELSDQVHVHVYAPGYEEITQTLDLAALDKDTPWTVKLEPAADAIRGRLMSTEGVPIVGGVVRYAPVWKGEERRMGACVSTTDHNGMFTLEECPKHRFWVELLPPDNTHVRHALEVKPKSLTGDPVEWTLRPAMSMEVLVTNPDTDEPVPGVEIALASGFSNLPGVPKKLRDRIQAYAVTDQEGHAVLEGFGRGRWILKADAQRWQRFTKIVTFDPEDPPRDIYPIPLRVARLLQGAVVDKYGAVVPNAIVTITPRSSVQFHVQTNDEGRFEAELQDASELSIESLHPHLGRGLLKLPPNAELDDLQIVALEEPTVDIEEANPILEPFGISLDQDSDAIILREVEDDSVAADMGLEHGDLVLSVRPVEDSNDVVLEIWRDPAAILVTLSAEGLEFPELFDGAPETEPNDEEEVTFDGDFQDDLSDDDNPDTQPSPHNEDTADTAPEPPQYGGPRELPMLAP